MRTGVLQEDCWWPCGVRTNPLVNVRALMWRGMTLGEVYPSGTGGDNPAEKLNMYQGVIFMFCIGLRTVFYKKKPESFTSMINLYLSENLVIWCDIYKQKRYFNLSLFNLQPPRSVIRSTSASTFNIKTSIFRNKDYV